MFFFIRGRSNTVGFFIINITAILLYQTVSNASSYGTTHERTRESDRNDPRIRQNFVNLLYK